MHIHPAFVRVCGSSLAAAVSLFCVTIYTINLPDAVTLWELPLEADFFHYVYRVTRVVAVGGRLLVAAAA